MATAAGSVPLAVSAFRTARRPVAGSVHDARRRSWFRPFVSKKLYSHLEEVTRDGVSLHYTGPRDLRRETPPLSSGSDNSQAFWQKTWELIRDGRVFAFTRNRGNVPRRVRHSSVDGWRRVAERTSSALGT